MMFPAGLALSLGVKGMSQDNAVDHCIDPRGYPSRDEDPNSQLAPLLQWVTQMRPRPRFRQGQLFRSLHLRALTRVQQYIHAVPGERADAVVGDGVLQLGLALYHSGPLGPAALGSQLTK